jgi:hypothetical protein
MLTMSRGGSRFDGLARDCEADPAVIGLVLGGSRGKGFGTDESDWDFHLIVAPDAVHTWSGRLDRERLHGLDGSALTLEEFASYAAWDGPFAWDRYSFADAEIVIDRTGEITTLVADKGRIPDAERDGCVRSAFDAHLNAVYRSMKRLSRSDRLGARLEAADSVGYALTTIFALEDRHRPFFGYLERELRARPLARFALGTDELLSTLAAILDDAAPEPQQRLLAAVSAACRSAGHEDVIAGWGDAFGWMMEFALPGGASPKQ